jgi:formate dehydrogenase maturation protein FdhE
MKRERETSERLACVQEMQNLQFKFSLVKQGRNFFSHRAQKFHRSEEKKQMGKSLEFASQVLSFLLGEEI